MTVHEIRGDDWVQLYVDGAIVYEGHSLDEDYLYELLKRLGAKVQCERTDDPDFKTEEDWQEDYFFFQDIAPRLAKEFYEANK